MVKMLMENEPLERLDLRQMGNDWIRAISGGEMERLEQFCQPEIVSQILTPKRNFQLETNTDLTARYRIWFGEYTNIQVEQSRVETVGERLGIFYRFLLQKQGSWERIEQQVYCTMHDGRVAELQLLCSGFHPAAPSERATLPEERGAGQALDDREALLVVHSNDPASGATCAILTPAIKEKLRELQPGQVLEVRVDDPTAREDIEAWCRLSGNTLLRMEEAERQELRFFVKKK
jgi:tRNA 2-thiouridine synthesizing protein A